ncbi:MAG: GGDEF domain-containing protein [Planctomycetota bacterium]
MFDTQSPPVTEDTPASVQVDSDATLQRSVPEHVASSSQESCLVQIYPPDVVDGMLLLSDDDVLFGRDPNVDVPLADSSVSRRHAKITRSAAEYVISDLGSTNGTLVNEQETQEHLLKSGDTIRIGSFLFKFLSAGSVESQYHETVYSALTRDALTGTLNKRYLLESLTREIARTHRQGGSVALVMLDIDHFKSINDTHGHLVGDEVLREFGSRIQTVCRADDMLARYGGEEFCLLLSDTQRDEALVLAERCRQVICLEPFDTAAGKVEVTASFGVAIAEATNKGSQTDLLAAADQKLYEAKEGGRNRVCV